MKPLKTPREPFALPAVPYIIPCIINSPGALCDPRDILDPKLERFRWGVFLRGSIENEDRPPPWSMFAFVCISRTADGPQRARLPIPPSVTLPACLWSLRNFPSLPGSRLRFFYRDARSALIPRQPMVECYLLTFSCFLLRKSELKSWFSQESNSRPLHHYMNSGLRG